MITGKELTVPQLAAALKHLDTEIATIQAQKAALMTVLAENGFGVVAATASAPTGLTLSELMNMYPIRLGAVFVCTDGTASQYFTGGKQYVVEEIDADGDVWMRDDDGDNYCVSADCRTRAVFRAV